VVRDDPLACGLSIAMRWNCVPRLFMSATSFPGPNLLVDHGITNLDLSLQIQTKVQNFTALDLMYKPEYSTGTQVANNKEHGGTLDACLLELVLALLAALAHQSHTSQTPCELNLPTSEAPCLPVRLSCGGGTGWSRVFYVCQIISRAQSIGKSGDHQPRPELTDPDQGPVFTPLDFMY